MVPLPKYLSARVGRCSCNSTANGSVFSSFFHACMKRESVLVLYFFLFFLLVTYNYILEAVCTGMAFY